VRRHPSDFIHELCLLFGPRGGSLPVPWISFRCSSSTSSGSQASLSSDRWLRTAISSYSSRASAAGPRRRPSSSTRTVRQKAPCGTTTVSPMRTVWLAFLITNPLTVTASAVQRRAARERLLTKRANHNHWSKRRLGGGGEALPFTRASALRAWRTGDHRRVATVDTLLA
jgi:hypothetical protein